MISIRSARLFALSAALSGVFVLSACSPAGPGHITAETDLAQADWNSLNSLVDRYPSESGLIDNSIITASLQNLLKDKHEAFKTNLKVESPLQRDGTVLYTSGNKQHEGGSNAAYLLIDTTSKTLEVGLWEDGKFTLFTEPGPSITKPADIRTLVANAENSPL